MSVGERIWYDLVALEKKFWNREDYSEDDITTLSNVIDYIESFNKELSEYYKTEIDIDICKVNSSDLDKLDDPKYDALSPSEIMALQFMLEDGDPGTTEN